MKLVFVIITILVITQVPKGESARIKRANAYIDFVEATANILQVIIPASEASVKNALEKLPKTEAYEKYRIDLEAYLEEVHASNETNLCIKTSLELMEKFFEFITEYSKDEAPEDAKVVLKFLNEGELEFDDELEKWKTTFAEFASKKDDEIKVKDIDPEDVARFVKSLTQWC